MVEANIFRSSWICVSSDDSFRFRGPALDIVGRRDLTVAADRDANLWKRRAWENSLSDIHINGGARNGGCKSIEHTICEHEDWEKY